MGVECFQLLPTEREFQLKKKLLDEEIKSVGDIVTKKVMAGVDHLTAPLEAKMKE